MPNFRHQAPPERSQINNIRIVRRVAAKQHWLGRKQDFLYQAITPDGRVWEEFATYQSAVTFAESTWDFLATDTIVGRINAAWRDLDMPKLDNYEVAHEHGQWWVKGWPKDDEDAGLSFWSVVPADGATTAPRTPIDNSALKVVEASAVKDTPSTINGTAAAGP